MRRYLFNACKGQADKNSRQFEEHRRLKLKASQAHLASIVVALQECEARINNAERPRALADPLFAGTLPGLRERREELLQRRNAATAKITAEFGDLLAEPVSTERKDPRDAMIDSLQAANAGLIERLQRCTCGAAS